MSKQMTLQGIKGAVWWVPKTQGGAKPAKDNQKVEDWLDHQLELEANATCNVDMDNKQKYYPLELTADGKGNVTCKMPALPTGNKSHPGTTWECVVPTVKTSGNTQSGTKNLKYILYRFKTANSDKPQGHANAKKQKLLVRVGKTN